MPLLKIFEIIENLFGFVNDEQSNHLKSDHSKRKISESTDICINCVNKNLDHSSLPLADFPLVSLHF